MIRICRRHHAPRSKRSGVTLYEVVLAITIFFIAFVGISQLVSIGSNAAVTAELQTEAAMLCESKLNEVIVGAVEMENVGEQPLYDDDPTWQWSLTVNPEEPTAGMMDLTVTVIHRNNRDQINASFTMRRFVRDPQVFIDAAEEAEEKAAEAAEAEAGLEAGTSGN